jgi:glycosyltransferase involved in cell wall biosynthesis
MRILLVHNHYGKPSGEEAVVRGLHELLVQHGHAVIPFFRSSAEILNSRLGAAKAFVTGVYSFASKARMRTLLAEHRADVVHIHNLFPLISPSILGECRRAGVPVVMTVHNYRLVCPSGLHMSRGRVCERCAGGREFHCVINRCEGGLLKSAGYALRNAVARKLRLFHRNVTMYVALTDFQRRRMIDAGFSAERIAVIPNMTSSGGPATTDEACTAAAAAPAPSPEPPTGDHVGYVGRISPEKGLTTLLKAAAMLPHVRFRIAGTNDRMPLLATTAPPNVHFVGHLTGPAIDAFYRNCRMLVLCSTWFEGFPMVLADAMLHAKPVICSRIGGLPEIVDDGRTGLLFPPGDAAELANHIGRMWNDPALCRAFGLAGRAKAVRCYSPTAYYERLIQVYSTARQLGAGGIDAAATPVLAVP